MQNTIYGRWRAEVQQADLRERRLAWPEISAAIDAQHNQPPDTAEGKGPLSTESRAPDHSRPTACIVPAVTI